MGGSSAPAEPSTTTQVQDIPAWEQGYVTDLLGQAQTEAAQPYQQFPGPQVAGFTDDQNQSFANVEGQTAANQANQAAALGQVGAGTNTANNIYGSGAGDINAATSYNPLAAVAPYLGAASQYNSAAAAQPGLNQASAYNAASAGAASPLGIQQYMSPYTNSVVGGIQNEANENWNQNIMPGINNEFIGAGQGVGSGRNAQVLGQAAGNFQTGLSANVANALQSGYTTAGNQAATEAGILGQSANTALSGANAASNAQTGQITNLLNQANTAGTGTQQEAANLNTAGVNLGNLASTQASQQLNAGTALGALGAQDASTNLQQNQALNAVGLQQQQQNQTNLNTAQTNFENQVQYPEQQTQFLNQIIRGLPAPTASTSAGEVTAPTTSPLQTLGGAGLAGLSINANSNGTGATVAKRGGLIKGKKRGGIIKGYAEGGNVGTFSDDEEDSISPLTMENLSADDDSASASPLGMPSDNVGTYTSDPSDDEAGQADAPTSPLHDDAEQASITPEQEENEDNQTSGDTSAPTNPLDTSKETVPQGITPQMMQQQQLLALARGMLTPNIGGQVGTAFGQGLGYLQDTTEKYQGMMAQQNALNYQRQQDAKKIAIEQQKADALTQNADTTKAYKANGPAGNKIVSVIGEDGKPTFMSAKDAMDKGLSPTAGYNNTTSRLTPEAIDKAADAIANGSKMSDLGMGFGQAADKQAILNRVAAKYPNLQVTDAQTQLLGDRAAARTIGTTGGKIEMASQSLDSMIPLAKAASEQIDRTQYPTINAIQNAVKKGTGDPNIIKFNTYLQAVINDQAALMVRSGASTDAARAKANDMANTAFSKGQINAYFDAAQKEIGAQRSAIKNAGSAFRTGAAPAADDSVAAKRAQVKALMAAQQGGQ